MKKTIFVYGNPLLLNDNLPLRLIPKLQKKFPNIEFTWHDPNENLKPINGKLTLIDTVQGIDRVMMIDNIDKIEINKIYSVHNFDLAFNLKLLHKIGLLKKVTIFGVPMGIDEEEALEELSKLINRL